MHIHLNNFTQTCTHTHNLEMEINLHTHKHTHTHTHTHTHIQVEVTSYVLITMMSNNNILKMASAKHMNNGLFPEIQTVNSQCVFCALTLGFFS